MLYQIRASLERNKIPFKVCKSGKEIYMKCFICSKMKLAVNTETLKFHCWVCGVRGNNFIKFCNKNEFNIFDQDDIFDLYINLPFYKHEKKEEEKDYLIDVKRKYENTIPISNLVLNEEFKDAISFLKTKVKNRNFEDILLHFNCRVDKNCDSVYFFSFENKEPIFYQRRIIRPKGDKRRYFCPPNFPISNFVFNEEKIDFTKPIVLVEGIFDAIAFYPMQAIPMFTNQIYRNSKLVNILSMYTPKIFFCPDNDVSIDVKNNSIKILLECGCDVYLVELPQNVKDPGEFDGDINSLLRDNSRKITIWDLKLS